MYSEMNAHLVTLALPESLYQTAIHVAALTGKPLEAVLQSGIAHALSPLDDVPLEEMSELAALALLDDGELWQVARSMMSDADQVNLRKLTETQTERTLTTTEQKHQQELLDTYGRVTLRKAHAYMLLARRGYRVPMQERSS